MFGRWPGPVGRANEAVAGIQRDRAGKIFARGG